MKKLPEVKGSWKELYKLATASVKSTVFIASIDLKLYDHIQKRATSYDVAEKTGYDKRNLELVLNVLAGMGLISKSDGYYENSHEAREFLVSGSESYMGDFFAHVFKWNSLSSEDYSTLVKNGSPDSPVDFSGEKLWAESAELSASYQYTGTAQRIALLISELPGFNTTKRILDLGGGAGFYSIAIAEKNPEADVVVFDQPEVIKVTQNNIHNYGAEERVRVMGGNYVTDSFGGKYDLILASATLNFIKSDLSDILQKIYSSLEPGGVFLSHADGLLNERTHPVNFITEFLSSELMGSDFGFPSGMIGEHMAEVGFSQIRRFFVDSDSGEMEVTVGFRSK